MLTARDIMTAHPLTITADTPLTEAARLMLEHHFNGLPVVDGQGTLLGLLCQSDLVEQHKKFRIPSFFILLDGMIPLQSPKKAEEEIRRMSATTAGDAMSHDPASVSPETPVEDLASLMADKKYYTLPVLENGKLIGVVGKEDLLRTMRSHA